VCRVKSDEMQILNILSVNNIIKIYSVELFIKFFIETICITKTICVAEGRRIFPLGSMLGNLH
jgi:hypothetical protein